MAGWARDELERFAKAEEIEITVRRRDGSPGKPVTVWCVRSADNLYVRSVKGRNGAWYRAVEESHEGRISAGRLGKDVKFEQADASVKEEVDSAYRSKYRRYAGPILNSCLTPEATSTTLRIVPS
jgi:hypothetical protein